MIGKNLLGWPGFGWITPLAMATLVACGNAHQIPAVATDGVASVLDSFVVDRSTVVPSRGSILLIHGSAPFDADGRIPVAGLDSPYARETFYLDLAHDFQAAGWDVLRYAKPGVKDGSVDTSVYATTDLEGIEAQLRRLWLHLPEDKPRVVFAWSEGTLHVRALPLADVDAVILLGGISSNIADVVVAQGGPGRDELLASMEGRDRREMLGIDRPVGRLLDEVALEDNWRVFAPWPDLPMLVLHGEADQEVPVSQAALWRDNLPHHRNLTVMVQLGRDHRLMRTGTYTPSDVSLDVLHWLDQTGIGMGTPRVPEIPPTPEAPDALVIEGSNTSWGVTSAGSTPSIATCREAPWKAELVTSTQPTYPEKARAEGIEGRVVLLLVIDTKGRVSAASVVEPAGHGLDEAALAATRTLVFRPPCEPGAATTFEQRWTFVFRLD